MMGRMSDDPSWAPRTVAGVFLANLMKDRRLEGLYLTDQAFRMHIDWACAFLDLAREVTGAETAAAIAGRLLEWAAGNEAVAADIRLMRQEAERFLLATDPSGLHLNL
jgi:hypothetical protein